MYDEILLEVDQGYTKEHLDELRRKLLKLVKYTTQTKIQVNFSLLVVPCISFVIPYYQYSTYWVLV